MSFAGACSDKTHRHVVIDRRCNHSAFNGYRRTPSAYSSIRCMVTGQFWRTKASYVNDLPNAKPGEDTAAIYPGSPS